MDMKTTAKFFDALVRHELVVMSRVWEGTMVYVHTFGCTSYLLAAPSVSEEVCMEEGDVAALMGWTGGVGYLLLCTGVFQVIVASHWTPC